ncbi:3-phenylpropionate-dihydrodiol/cinnamic acid-dihydrodiol dehydrogenase [Actinomadura sp. RB99]|uniref:SDR family oxidoreductase n=1 Tax=Actinomadura sp. RB99 TaxID=2691577 RepID=UPI0019ACE0CA|nr:3-phenylpropionate-dihydrodiol/cinnamic acid-dihydrodiol dehydrogenase [Actinomadura sp. RB99]
MTITDPPRPSVAVVTGAGSGLGRAIARALLDDGHVVVLAGRTRASLEDTAAGHPRAHVVVTDVTSAPSVRNLFASARALHGRIDVLINNAGILGPQGAVDEVEDGPWHDVLAANVTGSFLCAREAARIMKDQRPQGGRIINNGSLSAHVPRPRSVAYTVSKHAISGLTASMNLDLRDHGIACTQLDVGNAATAMTSGIGVRALQPDGTRQSEPTIDPLHVARSVAHVVSLPLEVNVPSLTVMARAMPYAGRG